MGKTFYLILSFLLVFFSPTTNANAYDHVTGPTCPLPPPQNIFITSVTPSGISINWTAVPGAALYKVTMYDQAAQEYLPDSYTTGTGLELTGLAPQTHGYTIGVSASACATQPEFGAEVTIVYQPGIIIIVDEIVQLNFNPGSNCPPPGAGVPVGICSQQESIPFNSSAPDLITAKRMRITSQSNPSSVFVDFLIWSDCFQQTRYYQISSKGVKRTKDGNILHFTYGNNYSLPFFDIINGNCDIGLCTITLKYHIPCLVANNTCYLPNESWSCGEKPAVNGTQQSRNSNGLSEIPAENALNPGRLHSEMPAASMKIAPNPFTDQFRLDYRLQEAGSVRIRLFDATGSAVAEVAPSQWQEEGMHRTDVTLQEELPPGIYFIVLQTDSYRQALPIIKE